ncbi:MAG: acetolactate synthase large subunit [Pseudomonadota bacterium]
MDTEMNGAEGLVRTLHAAGIEVCFANPGTSEMQFVDALDRTRLMRCVLALFEGVVTGAADGYARMTEKPAATLLHLGPGLANAGANIHNARKARTPMVNLVGEHAQRHLTYDAPLTADIEGLAAPLSDWVATATTAEGIAGQGAEAAAAALSWPGKIATLIAPGDTGWDPGGTLEAPRAPAGPHPLDRGEVARVAARLRQGGKLVLYMGGSTLSSPETLARAAAIAAATGARLMSPTSSRRMERGAGVHAVPRLPYPVDLAMETLAGTEASILIEAPEPVGFFAYPGKPSLMLPEGAARLVLATPEQDGRAAIAALAAELGAPDVPPVAHQPVHAPDPGSLTPDTLPAAVAAALPEGAIVVDEGISAGRAVWPATVAAPRHTWLALTGGAIGIGLPLAAGAAVACPDRPVLAIQADGSAMYTIQALWTMAREALDVTVVILANGRYESLQQELFKVGANPGPDALSLLDLTRPDLDFVAMAKGMGVDGARVDCPAALHALLAERLALGRGPFLIEALIG